MTGTRVPGSGPRRSNHHAGPLLLGVAGLVVAGVVAWLIMDRGRDTVREVPRAERFDGTHRASDGAGDALTSSHRGDSRRARSEHRFEAPGPERIDDAVARILVRSRRHGRPIEDVLVETIRRADDADSWAREADAEARTDPDGRVDLSLSPGRAWAIHVRATSDHSDGWLELEPFAPGETRDVVLELATSGDVSWYGRVTWKGRPRPGVPTKLLEFESSEARSIEETESDPDGLVHFVGSSWKSQDVRAEAHGVGVAIAELVSGHETPAEAQELPLWPFASIRAEVVGLGGEPLPGIEVTAISGSWWLDAPGGGFPSSPSPRVTAATDAAGVAVLADVVAEAPIAFELRRDESVVHEEVATLVVDAGQEVTRRFVLGGAGRVTGVVEGLDGRPLDDVQVDLYEYHHEGGDRLYHVDYFAKNADRTARTDSFGAFEIEDVPYGPWFVGTLGRGEPERFAMARRVELSAEQPEATVRLVFETGPSIAGVVVDPEGNALASVPVQCWSEVEGSVGRDITTDGGAFRIGPMPAGTYNVHVASPSGFVSGAALQVEAGTEDLRVELQRGLRLEGVVVDAVDGSVVSPCVVNAYAPRSDRPYAFHGNVPVDEGRFVLTALPAGEIALRARTVDGGIGILRGVVVGEGIDAPDVTIRLHRGVSVRVRYVGTPVEGLTILAVQDGVAVNYAVAHAGEAQTFFAMPGLLSVRALQGETLLDEEELVVRAGDDDVIVIGGQD